MVFCLVVWVGLCLVPLEVIIVGFVIMVGKGVVMGFTSRPRESSSVPFLNELLSLFGYPFGSAGALLAGTLPLLYCTTRFAGRIPTRRLPVPGHAASLVTTGIEVPSALGIEVSRVHCVRGSGLVSQRIRLNRKTPAHLVGFGIQCRPRVWKRLCPVEFSFSIVPDPKRRCIDQDDGGYVPAKVRTRPTSPSLRVFN